MTSRVLLTALVCLLLAAPADAHTMTLQGARRAADRFVQRIVADATSSRLRASIRGCERRTRHVTDCQARFRFGAETCDRTVRVRFTRPEERHVSTRFAGPADCF